MLYNRPEGVRIQDGLGYLSVQPVAGGGNVVVDSEATVQEGTATSFTYSLNNVAGTTVIVAVANFATGFASTVTYAAEALASDVNSNSGAGDYADLWRKTGGVNTGTNDVVVTFSDSRECVTNAFSVTGEHASITIEDTDTQIISASPTTLTLTSQTGGLCVQCASWFNQTCSETGDADNVIFLENNGATIQSGACHTAPGAASVALQYTGVSAGGHCALAIAPA